MGQIWILAGASIFGVLGIFHLVYTFFTKNLHPHDPTVMDAMKNSTLTITKETTVWKAWVGFNASHSFAALLMAAFYIPLALFHVNFLRASPWFSTLPLFVGVVYLALAKKYWFKVPFFGVFVATACFAIGLVLLNPF